MKNENQIDQIVFKETIERKRKLSIACVLLNINRSTLFRGKVTEIIEHAEKKFGKDFSKL